MVRVCGESKTKVNTSKLEKYFEGEGLKGYQISLTVLATLKILYHTILAQQEDRVGAHGVCLMIHLNLGTTITYHSDCNPLCGLQIRGQVFKTHPR